MQYLKISNICFILFLFSMVAFAAIPTIKITTQNGSDVTEKSYYVMNMELSDSDNPVHNLSKTGNVDSIKVRGNSTADVVSKKPYRIKFDKKTSLFELPAAKSWVLLANYYDNTQILNALAFELGKRFGLDFTPDYRFVDVYINNSYKGLYLLCDQIQVNENRINISKKDGWLVEFDYHAPEADEIRFQWTWNGLNGNDSLGTFVKSPDFDDPKSANIDWIKRDLDELSTKMFASDFPENGYRDLVDLEAMAKYIMIQKFLDNFDFNSQVQPGNLPGSNFHYKDVGGKITAGPLWDFDLSGGVTFSFSPEHFTTTGDDNHHNMIPTHTYYKRFFDDPVFLAKWKKLWDAHQIDFNNLSAFIDSIATYLEPSIMNNFNVLSSGGDGGGGWGGWGGGGSTYPSSYESYKTDQVNKLKTWLTGRQSFFNTKIDAMNIDVSKDIITSVPFNSKLELKNVSHDLPLYYSVKGHRLGHVKPVHSGIYYVKKGSTFEKITVLGLE